MVSLFEDNAIAQFEDNAIAQFEDNAIAQFGSDTIAPSDGVAKGDGVVLRFSDVVILTLNPTRSENDTIA